MDGKDIKGVRGAVDLYICPSCKTKNEENLDYCKKCGTWLLSTTHPAKKVSAKTQTAKRSFGIVALLVLIGVIWYGMSSGNINSPAAKMVFEPINIGEQYTISQLAINNTPASQTAIAADFTSHQAIDKPLEIVAVFYDGNGSRLGRASALLDKALGAEQTTTLNLAFDEPANLHTVSNVRIEVTPLSPMMLLERAAQMAK